MAAECLIAYKGQTVIFVGEGWGGCTGDDLFHDHLSSDFEKVEDYYDLPQWEGIHDYLAVYKRRSCSL